MDTITLTTLHILAGMLTGMVDAMYAPQVRAHVAADALTVHAFADVESRVRALGVDTSVAAIGHSPTYGDVRTAADLLRARVECVKRSVPA